MEHRKSRLASRKSADIQFGQLIIGEKARPGMEAHAFRGYDSEESTHLSVAATVAAGLAGCGFGLRAAAARFDLDFVPILAEQYFVVCHKPLLDTPGVQAIVEVLGSEDFRRQASRLPGYSTDGSGQVISLRRTLPWYK